MGKAEITLKSSHTTKVPRENRKPTVFKRSIRKLSEDKKHPGKIIRVYTYIDDDYKVFGVFTINTGGSISFFPDFYNLDNFDHITLNKDFIEKKGHLTIVKENNKHKKLLNFEAVKLPTNDYHLVTFVMTGGDLLMDSLQEVSYPDIEFENDKEEEFLALLKDAIHTQPLMLDFPDEKGFYCIQVLIIPKGRDINNISIETGIVEDFLSKKEPLDKIINAKKLEVITPDNFDFSLCFITFKVNKELRSPFAFGFAGNSNK